MTACAYRPRIVMQCVPLAKQCTTINKPGKLSLVEKLNYVVSWHGIPSGRLTIETKGIETIGNRNYYHIVANAGPNDFFAIFFNIKYTVETYVDSDTGLPLKFYRNKSHRGKKEQEAIIFDHNANSATWEYTHKAKKSVKIDENSQDLLSFLYYFRLKGFASDKLYNFNIVYDGKSWPVQMKVDNLHLLKLRNGKCIEVISAELTSPLISEIMGSSKLNAYVGADAKRIPIFFTVKTKMGEADTVLSNLDSLD
ncbi:MAG: DUF3108 domain-containing protein [Candidatus Omnitrophota bacterium]